VAPLKENLIKKSVERASLGETTMNTFYLERMGKGTRGEGSGEPRRSR